MRLFVFTYALFAAASCGNPLALCQDRVLAVSRSMVALSDRHRTGCTTHADCVAFEPNLPCASICQQTVLARDVAQLTRELDQLGRDACGGVLCKASSDCAAFEMPVCHQGVCVKGRADGGPE